MMTCGEMTRRYLLKLRTLGCTLLISIRATGAESAAAGRIKRTRNIALKHYTLGSTRRFGICLGNSRNKALCIRVNTVSNKLIAIRQFDKLTKIHNAYRIGYMLYNAKVMRDEKIGKTISVLKVIEQVDYLRLYRNVKS